MLKVFSIHSRWMALEYLKTHLAFVELHTGNIFKRPTKFNRNQSKSQVEIFSNHDKIKLCFDFPDPLPNAVP